MISSRKEPSLAEQFTTGLSIRCSVHPGCLSHLLPLVSGLPLLVTEHPIFLGLFKNKKIGLHHWLC